MTKVNNSREFNPSTEILKAAALMQFNGESFFFLVDSEGEIRLFGGTEEEAKEAYQSDMTGITDYQDYPIEFEEWAADHLTEVEPITGDEERDGYIVLTDEEADEKAAEYIKDSLWAFNASFIIEHSKLPYDAEEMISTYQKEKCEDANSTIEALIEDMDEFIKDAISADGRGHFLNTYDGHENEETVEGETFYIYRMN